ncbi:MAG: hypothetical protein KIT02_10575 [Devosia sp.]|uniref:DUF6157 family protein n=1 Tax=Devosia sp. TaxID=1871048 RepID=UPI0024CD21E8|nr:DUF6157 family protein [Devosia sp.]UYN98402.1 MAG: hypothetical protein KIT02_10575 [Devosia sp.]
MHTTNYFDTLITPSPDTKATGAVAPSKPGTVASMLYDALLAAPYGLTSDEVIFGVHADRKGIDESDRGPARMAFFSSGQACLRSSALVKTLGWALHHDSEGRVALVDPASQTYRNLMERDDITKRAGLRTKRN